VGSGSGRTEAGWRIRAKPRGSRGGRVRSIVIRYRLYRFSIALLSFIRLTRKAIKVLKFYIYRA
jgi:hypothetical protein